MMKTMGGERKVHEPEMKRKENTLTDSFVSFDEKSSKNELSRDKTRSSTTSMQTLRRILEVEEWRRVSERIDMRIEKKFPRFNHN